MPNHVTTILEIEDGAGMPLLDIRRVFINDKGVVDFNLLMPMPECLNDFKPHSGIISRASAALGLLPDPSTLGDSSDFSVLTRRLELSNAIRDASTPPRSEDVPLIVRAIQNHAECGFMYWYDWCQENWGTKWNCYGQNGGHPADATSFQFETAWAHPVKMIEIISRRLPGVVLHVRYADEDLGSNCGEYRIKNGARFDEDVAGRFDEGTDAERKKWTAFAFRINYGEDEPPEAHGYDDNWEYSDDIYDAYEAKQSGALN